MKYNFYVKSANEVDIRRILRETPEGEIAVLLTALGNHAVLLLRCKFLDRFIPEDRIRVSGKGSEQNLCSGWGYPSVACTPGLKGVILRAVGQGYSDSQVVAGWRCINIDKTDIALVKTRLDAARAYVPHREVRVSYL
jgi:hypothetical protein